MPSPIYASSDYASSDKYDQSTRDMARDWLNNSDLADEFGEASEERAEEVLADACREIVESEEDEADRVASHERPRLDVVNHRGE